MGGCGMVDPNVFDAVGIDSEKYTGWAFGFGIERLAMRKYGITDIACFLKMTCDSSTNSDFVDFVNFVVI